MFKRISDTLKVASEDKNYTILCILLFLTLISSYFITSPVIWFICLILVILLLIKLVIFYIRYEKK